MSRAMVRAVSALGAILAATVFGAGELRAQQTGTLTGQVTAQSTGEPLSDAQVSIQALNLGTLTRTDGRYLVTSVPTGTHTVSVTYVGYGSVARQVTISPSQSTSADFTLATSAINLDEIVVTGTGGPTQRRQLGQTINSVSAADLEVAPIQNVTDALQGRVPGMTGTAFGLEGGGARIRLRGAVSLSQRNTPLIYIDGVRVDNTFNDAAAVATSRLNDINPSNVERIEVIKGAAAATLFGTEASSGVIQIFTKRGTVSEPVYTFRMDQRISSIDAEEGMPRNWAWDADSNQLLSNHPAPDFVEPAWQQDFSASVRGGTPGVKYFASGRISNQPGSAPNNEADNYSLRTTLDFAHTDKLSSSLDVNVTRNELRAPHPWWGAFAEFMLSDPAAVTEERPYGEQDFTIQGALDFRTKEVTDNRIISGGLSYSWTDNVRSDLQVGVNDVDIEDIEFIPAGEGNPAAPDPGTRNILKDQRTVWTIDFKNNARFQLTDDIESTTVVGAQSFWENTVVQETGVSNFPSPALETLRGGSTVTDVDEFTEEVINAGVFLQQQLGFGGRFFLTAGMRMDGNSAFGEDFGFEFYPKAGASWVISDESWWNVGLFDQVRLRAAYGTSGLQPGAFDAQRTWEPVSGIENNQALLPLNLGNPDLKPERSREIEFGTELTALNDRLGLEVVYFDQKTSDALLPATVSPSLGFLESQLMNIGALESKGVEVLTNWTVFEGREWGLSVNGSYSWIDQEVTDMGGVPPFRIEGRRRWSQIREGYSPGAVIAPVHDPDDPWSTAVPIDEVTSPAQIQPNWLQASDGTDSLVYIGESSPTWNATFGSNLSLPFDLTARTLFRAEGGFIISRESELIRQNLHYNRFMAELNRALDPDGGVSAERKRELIAQYGNRHPNMFSDWMEEGDYLRLQEISLTWQVPDDLVSRVGFSGTSISFSARNVFIWDPNYNGIVDPGHGLGSRSEFLQNIDYMQGPSPRTFGLTVRTSIR